MFIINPYAYGVTLWTPASLGANLKLWIHSRDAANITESSGNISQWNDLSGNGYHLTQGTTSYMPAWSESYKINGYKTPYFDGSAGMEGNSGLYALGSGNSSGFAVWEAVDTDGMIFCARVSAGTNTLMLATGDGSSSADYARTRSNTDSLETTSESYSSASPVAAGFVKSSTTITPYTSGTAGIAKTATDNTLVVFRFGAARFPTWNNPLTGKIGEIVLINCALTDENRQKIEGYLAYWWGLQGSLPVDHPYKSSPPTA